MTYVEILQIFGSLMRTLEFPKIKHRLRQGETNFGCDFIEDLNPNSKSFQVKLSIALLFIYYAII